MHLKVLLALHRSTTHKPLIIQITEFLACHLFSRIERLLSHVYELIYLYPHLKASKLPAECKHIFTFHFHYASKRCSWHYVFLYNKGANKCNAFNNLLQVQVLDCVFVRLHFCLESVCTFSTFLGYLGVKEDMFLRGGCFPTCIFNQFFQSTWCWHSHTVWDPEITFTHI